MSALSSCWRTSCCIRTSFCEEARGSPSLHHCLPAGSPWPTPHSGGRSFLQDQVSEMAQGPLLQLVGLPGPKPRSVRSTHNRCFCLQRTTWQWKCLCEKKNAVIKVKALIWFLTLVKERNGDWSEKYYFLYQWNNIHVRENYLDYTDQSSEVVSLNNVVTFNTSFLVKLRLNPPDNRLQRVAAVLMSSFFVFVGRLFRRSVCASVGEEGKFEVPWREGHPRDHGWTRNWSGPLQVGCAGAGFPLPTR